MTGCCVVKFLWRSVDGKHLMRFQGENAVLKFFWRSVGGELKLPVIRKFKPELIAREKPFLEQIMKC